MIRRWRRTPDARGVWRGGAKAAQGTFLTVLTLGEVELKNKSSLSIAR